MASQEAATNSRANLCLHRLFELQAARTPHRTAVHWEDRDFSYSELNRSANRLARHLRRLGVKPDLRVALCAERSFEMVVAMLAVLKAGGAYVPLDPAYPGERLRFLLADSAPRVLLCHGPAAQSVMRQLRGALESRVTPAIVLEDSAPLWAQESEADLPAADIALAPEHPAYLIYTSGSTGRPKGVTIEHRNVVNFVHWASECYSAAELARTLFSTSINFDLHVFELFVPLCKGGSVVLVRNALELLHTVEKVTLINTVPTVAQALIDAGRVPSTAETINLAGEPLKRSLAEQIFAHSAVRRICNLYGPSETTTYSTWLSMPRAEGFKAHIGRAIANTRIYLLDSSGNEVPTGSAGEIYIAGEGVARGYLNQPALTAERFLPDRFTDRPGARMYRTGDLGRLLPDGYLEFLGRLDHQVKVRGFRIEPGEIEACLAEHGGVREAVVLVREDDRGEKSLVAYVISERDRNESPEAMRRHIAAHLPEYMIPAAYVTVDSWPLMPNGKLDRAALPAPTSHSYAARPFEAPHGELEQKLANVWADVLKVERVGRHDRFFELGGHSLSAVMVLARIRDVLGIDVSVRCLFLAPTVADFVASIQNATQSRMPALTRNAHGSPCEPSFAQQRLWFLSSQVEGASETYHIPARFRLRGALDREALRHSLNQIVERHEALRTTFRLVDGRLMQHIEARWEAFALREHDLRGREHAPVMLERLAREEAAESFDLAQGPLIRGRLICLAETDHVLLITTHHIVCDGWSMGVLKNELSVLYAANCCGEPNPLPPLPIVYADYALWQRQWSIGEAWRTQSEYWQRTLADAPPSINLPTDRARPPNQDFNGGFLDIVLDKELTRRLKEFSRHNAVTLYMTVLTAWVSVLSRLSSQEDIVVGSPVANRVRTELESLIGFFVNTVALRVDVSGNPTIAQLLKRVKERALEAQEHQDLPFEQVVEIVNPARSLRQAQSPLFQATFAWQNFDAGALTLPGLSLVPEPTPSATTKFDLQLFLNESEGRIVGGIEYASALFDAETVVRYAGYLRRTLQEMVCDDQQRISELSLLDGRERDRLLRKWNAELREYSGECIHTLVEQQTAAKPHAIALEMPDRCVTYGELNEWAERVAQWLRSLALSPESLVSLCAERSAELAAGMLGIWKAGCVYVPLEPTNPEQRLKSLVEDAQPSAMLTQGAGTAAVSWYEGPRLELGTLMSERPIHVRAESYHRAEVTGRHAAYVIYTSGSSGVPKGCVVEHRALSTTLEAAREVFGFSAADAMPTLASHCFDISLLEWLVPLISGGRVRVISAEAVKDLPRLTEQTQSATFIHAVPSLMESWLERAPRDSYQALRCILVGGEAVPQRLIEALQAHFKNARLYELYGPTEGTLISTYWAAHEPSEQPAPPHCIGRRFDYARTYVLDEQRKLQPTGIPGELYIGGSALARGYLNRPELTQARFVHDPYCERSDARMYRTGDCVRHLSDGRLEYLGRLDQQVKLRGFRIEPGEIEARLREQPGIREALVMLREDAPGDKRLVAYVTEGQQAFDATTDLRTRQVVEWSELYDETYGQSAAPLTPDSDWTGWNSSYTRQPFPADEMREWLDGVCTRILALRPRRVLEIGCGTGLVLFRVAPECERYVGSDLSAQAIASLSRRVAAQPQLRERAHLVHAEAQDFSAIPVEHYDTVILNSVAQYFPDIEYLQAVIAHAIEAVQAHGRIFVGDVRHYGLVQAFHLSVQLHQASPDISQAALAARVAQRVRTDAELSLDPVWFFALRRLFPQITRVEVMPKATRYDNEMSAFRYDVVLHVGINQPRSPDVLRIDFDSVAHSALISDPMPAEQCAWRQVQSTILAATSPAIVLTSIPNARVRKAALMSQRSAEADNEPVATLQEHMAASDAVGVTCDALVSFANQHGYFVRPSWFPSGPNGAYHALFLKRDFDLAFDWTQLAETEICPAAPARYASEPLRAKRSASRPEQLRTALASVLPQYMIPAAFVVLDGLPLTVHGKLNRLALPAPEVSAFGQRAYEAPRSGLEVTLANIWADLLKVDRVGRRDHFFDLGGHSLLAVTMAGRARQALGKEIALVRLFEAPILEDFARVIATASRNELPPPVRTDRAIPTPLSFSQQRLWFLSQLEGANQSYHMPLAVRITGDLSVLTLKRALNCIVARHESLRTSFASDGEQLVQVVASPDVALAWRELDVRERSDLELQRILSQEARAPFSLSQGPLIRALLVQEGAREHVLLITMHHIVSDGWSMGVLKRELSALYRAYLAEASNPLPSLPIQYIDYSRWQRQYFAKEALQRQAEFWSQALANAPAALDLPLDRPRPERQDLSGGFLEVEIDCTLTQSLESLSRRYGTTLFMTILTGWAVLLSRLSGQHDVVIGTPVANRRCAELEPMIGVFINTLALRIDLSGNPTIEQLLKRVKHCALEAQENQDLPFEQVVDLVKPMRSLQHSPIFQTMLAWQNIDEGELELPGLVVRPEPVDCVGAAFDLTCDLRELNGRIVGGIEFATALFDVETVQRYARYLHCVLEEMARDERQRISELLLLEAHERHRLLTEWNGEIKKYAAECIHTLVERQAARAPNAIALESPERCVRYRELEEAAGRVAQWLRNQQLPGESLVGVCAPRSVELAAAMLGIWKAGCVYVPLEPTHPQERLRYLVADAQPRAMLTQGSGAKAVHWYEGPLLQLERLDEIAHIDPAASLGVVHSDVHAAAYVIYTSGSSGEPKGCVVEHHALSTTLEAARQVFGFGASDVMPTLASHSFDISLLEWLLPLISGGRVRVVSADAVKDLPQLIEQTRGVTFLHAVPSLMEAWLERTSNESYAELRRLLVGGEAVSQRLLDGLQSRFAEAQVYELYGPTEAALISTFWAVSKQSAHTSPAHCIGQRFDYARTYILDEHGNLAPIGVAGELYIGGSSLARGYLNRPELTAERFVADPFSADATAKMYRTGDCVRYLADGRLEYLGRLDQQVKLRGYRIEPGEIEAKLLTQPGIREAVVVLREVAPDEKRLVAYVTATHEALDTSALRAALAATLPEYMLPSAYLLLPSLPRTANGKVDRKALPLPNASTHSRDAYEPPLGDTEIELAGIWVELLKVERVSRHDNFFDLGGHSLLATKLVARISNSFGVDATLQMLFAKPVFCDFADRLVDLQLADFLREGIATPN